LSAFLHLDYIQMAMVGFLIAIVYKLLIEIISRLFKPYRTKAKTFSQAVPHFRYKYWTQNPATKLAEEGRY
jgi:hypothetical protein